MTEEKIPPLPKLPVAEFDREYIDPEKLDRAMQIIYERRPNFFKRSFERDKRWEADPTQDAEDWVHDEFSMDLNNYIRHEVLKEIGITDHMMLTTIQTRVFFHVRRIAHAMYGTPIQNKTL
jgi:hypothetical protein